MSLDFVVWRSQDLLDVRAARIIYEALVLGEADMPSDPAVSAMEQALGAIGVPIELDRGTGFLEIHLPVGTGSGVAESVRELALAHGLTVFDPQDSAVYQPLARS